MTAEKLQDVIGLLPADLILETDKVRTAPRAKVLPLRRWAALAAVLALVAGTTFAYQQNIGLEKMTETVMKQESAVAQEPAAAAPMAPQPMEDEVAAEEVMPEAPAQDSASGTTTENGICIDHAHCFAEEQESGRATGAYCGNMEVTLDIAGEKFTVTGTDAVRITDILVNLNYDPAQVCRCMTDITVDTETLKGIQVNTAEGFARCEKGQAALTEEQAQILQEIIDKLQ